VLLHVRLSVEVTLEDPRIRRYSKPVVVLAKVEITWFEWSYYMISYQQ